MSLMEQQYLDLGNKILTEGKIRKDRTGVGTIGLFGAQIRCNLTQGEFPLLTTKKVFFKPMVAELIWFLEGSTDNNRLNELGAKIWDKWQTEDGSLGKIYGHQWVKWEEIKIIPLNDWVKDSSPYTKAGYKYQDEFYTTAMLPPPYGSMVILKKEHNQISELIHNLKTKPFSRRHVISAWFPSLLPDESKSPQQNVLDGKMCLAPCHCLFQFHVEEMTDDEIVSYAKQQHESYKELSDTELLERKEELGLKTKKLNCQLYQRKPVCAY